MRKIVQRLLKIVELIGLGAFVTLIAALIVSFQERLTFIAYSGVIYFIKRLGMIKRHH